MKRVHGSLISVFNLLLIMIIVFPVMASDEYELFREGYELYLSCEPVNAAEKFETFIKEFPDSSAKDSALYWLGKALMQMGKLDKAEKVFRRLRTDLPGSPFSLQALREIDRIKSMDSTSGVEKALAEKKTPDKELSELRLEKDRLTEIVEEGKKKMEVCEKRLLEADEKLKDIQVVIKDRETLEEKIKRLDEIARTREEELRRIREERDRLSLDLESARRNLERLELMEKELLSRDSIIKERQDEIASLKREIETLRTGLKETEKKLDSGKMVAADYETKLKELARKEEEIRLLINKKEELEKKVAVLEGDISNRSEEINKIKEEKEGLIKEIEGLRARLSILDEVSKKIGEKEVLLNEKQKEVESLRNDIKKRQEEQDRLNAEIEGLKQEREKYIARLQEMRDSYSKLLMEKELLKNSITIAADKVEELKVQADENKRLAKKLLESEKRIQVLENDLSKVMEDAKILKEEKEHLRLAFEEKTKEIEELRKSIVELNKRENETKKQKEDAERELLDLRSRLIKAEERLSEVDVNKLRDERDRLNAMLLEEKRQFDKANSEIIALKDREKKLLEREKELLDLNASLRGVMESRVLELGQKLQACERDLTFLRQEKAEKERAMKDLMSSLKSLNKEVTRLQVFESEAKKLQNIFSINSRNEEKIRELEGRIEILTREGTELMGRLKKKEEEVAALKIQRQDLERLVSQLGEKAEGLATKFLIIDNKKFSTNYILSYLYKTHFLLSKIGVGNIPWKTGDPVEDFIAEHLLYEAAQRVSVSADRDDKKLNTFVNLDKEELEYIERFNIISKFINNGLKKLPPDRFGETVVLHYSDEDRYEKAAMVVDIQDKMRSGFSARDIVKLYHGAEYTVLSARNILDLFGGLANSFSDNEVVSTFNRERFMVIKVRVVSTEFRPFDSAEKHINERIKEYTTNLVQNLKAKRNIIFPD